VLATKSRTYGAVPGNSSLDATGPEPPRGHSGASTECALAGAHDPLSLPQRGHNRWACSKGAAGHPAGRAARLPWRPECQSLLAPHSDVVGTAVGVNFMASLDFSPTAACSPAGECTLGPEVALSPPGGNPCLASRLGRLERPCPEAPGRSVPQRLGSPWGKAREGATSDAPPQRDPFQAEGPPEGAPELAERPKKDGNAHFSRPVTGETLARTNQPSP
jgi:hypothetical protein